jgi:phage regulator Rha-like protein
MSSLEIADLCSQIPGTKAKEHKHIMRDIRDMFGTLGISTESKIGLCEKINELGLKRSYSYYILTREESDILISGYSIPYRAAIIRRWHDLEKQVVTPKLDRHDGDFKKLAETVAGLSLVMAELIKRVG